MPLLFPNAPYCLLEDGQNGMLFTQPNHWIKADHIADVPAALKAVDQAAKDGDYCVGYIHYEAAQAFHPTLNQRRRAPGPLVCFGVFPAMQRLAGAELARFWQDKALAAPACSHSAAKPHWSDAEYTQRMLQILEHLRAGDIYQANLTFTLTLDIHGSAEALYARLRRNQPAAYSAFMAFEEDIVLSLSPERFFAVSGEDIVAQPMKGTAAIDSPGAGDALRMDSKNRAENLMITDLLRNDLSRVARRASVDVPALFQIERLPSVYQMTSRVTAKRRPDATLPKLMEALFPCGSVTGAPKLSAMQIIDQLEAGPRGVYCGAIGVVEPSGDMSFNVPIRTIVQNQEGAALSVGSGVVADSTAQEEYRECLLKADFLNAERPNFSLIETMRYEPGANLPQHWALHKERLARAAAYFGFQELPGGLEQEVACFLASLPAPTMKVRLLYSQYGSISLSAAPLKDSAKALSVRLGQLPAGTPEEFLRYKTTYRWPYSAALQTAQQKGACDEVFLTSDTGTLHEGSYTNIFIEKNGQLLTPDDTDAFLPGVLRAHLLATGRARSAVITAEDLHQADAIYAGNALRGLMPVTLLGR